MQFCDPNHNVPHIPPPQIIFLMTSLEPATVEEVEKLILSSQHKSCDLDPLPTKLSKYCLDVWLTPITNIVSIVRSLRDREVACLASDRQGSTFEFCVWRTVSSQSSHHPQEVLLAQFSLYVHKGGLKPDSFHFPSRTLSIPALSQTF